MGPNLAASLPRPRFLFGLLLASVIAFAMTRPSEPPRRDYKHFKRVGKCVDGKWVPAHRVVPARHHAGQ